MERTLDARKMMCPKPIVMAKKEFEALPAGHTLKIVATDKSSVFDFQAWAKMTKRASLVKQETSKDPDGTDIYLHFVLKEV